ncbi:CobW family GTP-binding protein [Aeromonas cavernicola]|uniref:GTP-binding protein n=1 Tax=Aeromonas cavernicola TaxID=1006623 RepID=A0A2H9U408_9GAMM|nr:GTP-binding protein [Aeromonas cavernicola]PJG58776.1 GTP-binding protein [Aeromonas cavernicola]
MTEAIAVTLLTGFLGAGKTTLLNYFLRHHRGAPLAILENEFGGANIDGALIEGGEGVSVVELGNGCVCCSVRGEFATALSDLLDRRAQGEIAFERIIIEATGLADPGPIIQTFFVDERLREALRLDAVITLADCQHIGQQLDEHPVAAAQLGFADRILLSKCDRVDDATREAVVARLQQINHKAEILDVLHGECPSSLWLDLAAFTLSDELPVYRGLRIVRASGSVFAPLSGQARSWHDTITAHLLEGGLLDLKQIGAFMEQCIDQHGNDMLRYKGILAIAGEPRRLIVQGVHKVVGFDYGSPWGDQTPRSTLVIIGRHLPLANLRAEFAATEVDIKISLT